MYAHLSAVNPTNGFEIVFVSSDRDLSSFESYYSAHPWKAIPFDHLQVVKQSLNMTYGVRGIPSLVVLDPVSGRVVVPASQSHQEVLTACHGGKQNIEGLFESWLGRVPPETQELIHMLELSIEEDSAVKEKDSDDHPYLRRKAETVGKSIGGSGPKTDGMAAEVKMHFERLMKSGEHDPNSAAARALSLAAGGSAVTAALAAGDLNGKATYMGPPRLHDPVDIALVQALDWNDASSVSTVLSTAQKYLKNVIEKPWDPRFRTFRLSNKVADSVTSVEGGWGLLQALGFEVVSTSHDFKATIPVSAEVEAMEQRIVQLIQDVTQ
jgi:Thioredoxin-like/PUB domain